MKLKPKPKVLTVAISMVKFYNQFFTREVRRIRPNAMSTLETLKTSRTKVIIKTVLPTASTSFMTSALFSLRSSIHSTIILKLINTKNVNIRLTASVRLLQCSRTVAVVLMVFLIIVIIRRMSSAVHEHLV